MPLYFISTVTSITLGREPSEEILLNAELSTQNP